MEEKLSGIVLSSVEFGENDKILNIFTLEKGIVSAKIKGVKKAGAKLKFASEPFCFAEFIFMKNVEKRTVINASLTDSFYPIREDIDKFFAGGTALEFIKKFAKQEMVSADAFLLLADTLKKLAYGGENPQSILSRFLISGLALVGYGLNISSTCLTCGKKIGSRPFFDYESGAFYCESCAEGVAREINAVTFNGINKIKNGENITKEEGIYLLRLIDYYLNVKLDENLISLKELIRN